MWDRPRRAPSIVTVAEELVPWLERSWGPLLYVATADIENLRQMIPSPNVRFSPGRSLDGFLQQLTVVLRRAVGGPV